MNCQHIRNFLMDYHEGVLNPSLKQEVSRHLESCSDCQDFYHVLKDRLACIEMEKAVDYDPFMLAHIQAVLQKPATRSQPVFLRGLLQPALLVLLLLLMVYTGIRIGREFSYKSYVNQDYNTELYYLSDVHETNYETALLND
jgi:predicted anti-sigma-YlaC factor YlaD